MTLAPLERESDRAGSQTLRAQLALRELVLGGALGAGERLTEQGMVERLGVSRTPVRAALLKLADEGLLDPLPSGGFTVRAFAERDAFDAIEIRGTLEGLAVRLAAERGVSPAALKPLETCLDGMDAVVHRDPGSLDVFQTYVDLNARFHDLVVRLCDSPAVERQIERAMHLPFASPSAFVLVQATMPEARQVLIVAQDQHRCIVDAITAREGARAEHLMREHSRLARRNLAAALAGRGGLALIPGATLLRPSAEATARSRPSKTRNDVRSSHHWEVRDDA